MSDELFFAVNLAGGGTAFQGKREIALNGGEAVCLTCEMGPFVIVRPKPARFLVEVSTYPYRRLSKQVIDGTVLAYLNREELPEVLTLVLHPGGRKRVAGAADLASPHGWTRLHLE